MPVEKVHQPWQMTKEEEEASGVVVGRDYPKPPKSRFSGSGMSLTSAGNVSLTSGGNEQTFKPDLLSGYEGAHVQALEAKVNIAFAFKQRSCELFLSTLAVVKATPFAL